MEKYNKLSFRVEMGPLDVKLHLCQTLHISRTDDPIAWEQINVNK